MSKTPKDRRIAFRSLLAAAAMLLATGTAFGHGDVTPQAIDTTGLDPLGDQWRNKNPYRGNELAVSIGKSGYNQNCARCHGLGAVSGGIAPDLRYLPIDDETDDYFINTVRKGRTRNGRVYMPPFEGTLSQEGLWAIRSWLETVHEN